MDAPLGAKLNASGITPKALQTIATLVREEVRRQIKDEMRQVLMGMLAEDEKAANVEAAD